jgi:hypothetical protein
MRICAAKLGIIYSINCCHLYTFITMMRKLMQCSFLTFLVFSNNIYFEHLDKKNAAENTKIEHGKPPQLISSDNY